MSHAQDAILVGHMENGNLYRIPILDNGAAGEAVAEPIDTSITQEGINGVAWHEGVLYVVRDRLILKLAQAEGSWTSQLIAELEHPTSFVFFRGGSGVIWAVESQLDLLLDNDSETQALPPFKIMKISLND